MTAARLSTALVIMGCGARARDHQSDDVGGAFGEGVGGGDAGAETIGGGDGGTAGAPGAGTEAGGATAGGDAAGEAGAGGAWGGLGDGVALGRSSWDVELQVAVEGPWTCGSTAFTLHLEPAGAGLALISGRNGSVIPGELARITLADATPAYRADGMLGLPARGDDCSLPGTSVTKLWLVGRDDDSDGTADRLEGHGEGRTLVVTPEVDVGTNVELSFELSGVPDVQRPTLLVPPESDPFSGVYLSASEPIALGSTVTLIDAANATNQLSLTGYTESEGALGAFSSQKVLPFGSTWNVTAAGSDLADLPFVEKLGTIQMLADPGLFAQDGFESPPQALLSGGAVVVAGLGTLPALSGTKSLFLPPSSAVVLHLRSSVDVTTIRYKTRTLSIASEFTIGTAPVQIATIGGTERLVVSSGPVAAEPAATGDTAWPYAGPPQDHELLLPEPGKDVVVRITRPPSCGGFCPSAQAFLVDDFAIE